MASLASTVYVQDPETHQTVRLDEGTTPEPRLAALVTNPAAWVDRKLPRLPKAKQTDDGPSDGGQGEGSGAVSAAADDQSNDTAPAESEDAKPAARKAAARPARGRKAADEGTGGQ